MNTISEIIKHAQRFLFCPICNRSFNLEEIRLRGFLDDVYILQVKCEKMHNPVSMTVIVGKGVNIGFGGGNNKLNNISDNKMSQIDSVTESDIYALGQSLDNFDGNFESLWKK